MSLITPSLTFWHNDPKFLKLCYRGTWDIDNVDGTAILPWSRAFFCRYCGDIWGRITRSDNHFYSITDRSCRSHLIDRVVDGNWKNAELCGCFSDPHSTHFDLWPRGARVHDLLTITENIDTLVREFGGHPSLSGPVSIHRAAHHLAAGDRAVGVKNRVQIPTCWDAASSDGGFG